MVGTLTASVWKIDIANKIPLLRGGASVVWLQGCVIRPKVHTPTPRSRGESHNPPLLFNLQNTCGALINHWLIKAIWIAPVAFMFSYENLKR
jgi:hypothetical protein